MPSAWPLLGLDLSAWIDKAPTDTWGNNPVLYAMLAASAALICSLVLAVPGQDSSQSRLFRAQQKWAETMENQDSP